MNFKIGLVLVPDCYTSL